MISKAKLLRRYAGFAEVFSFSVTSFMVVVLVAFGGAGLLDAVPELVGSSPGLTETYLSKLSNVLFDAVILVVGCGLAILNHRILRNTVARCELSEDELAWIKDQPDYERMAEDSELMRLAANVSRMCRTYQCQNPLFERFLEEYLTLLNEYGWGLDETMQEARIERLNTQADEGLERYAARVRREGMRKEREGG